MSNKGASLEEQILKLLRMFECASFQVFHEGAQKATHPNKNSLHKQFAQTISGQFVQTVPLFPLKLAENKQKSLRKLFVQTVFIWVGLLPLSLTM